MTRAHLHYNEYTPPDSLVYLIKGHKQYKIGYSTHFSKRLTELQIGNEYPLTVVALISTPLPQELEAQLQEQYQEYKGLGEWFSLTEEHVEAIRNLE